MSWRDNLTECRARISALEAAETAIFAGGQVLQVSYDGGVIQYAKGATLREVQGALRECRTFEQRLSGGRRTGGVISPVFR